MLKFGAYENDPATLLDAFSCAAPRAVPYTIAAGAGHVTVGAAFAIVRTADPDRAM